MRDYSIDYIKGVAVIMMIIVHPLMMMTNYNVDPTQNLLAIVGYYLTQPIAGLFLFALGFVMAIKKRPISNVIRRSSFTLFLAIIFGFFIDIISEGDFFFSVLFVAAVVNLSVGLIVTFSRDNVALIAMGVTTILISLIPLILNFFPQPQIISGILMFPMGKSLMNFWVWDTPVLPYLITGLFGGMLAISSRLSGSFKYVPYLFIIISLFISLYLAVVPHITLFHTVIVISLSLLYPLFLSFIRSRPTYNNSMFILFGRNVTFIYFFHHLLLSAACFLFAGVSFNCSSFYMFNGGATVINSYLIIGTIIILVFGSRLTAIWIENYQNHANTENSS